MNSLFIGVLYTVTIVGGGCFVATGGLAVSDLAIYALYIGIFISPIEQPINFVETFQKATPVPPLMEVLAVRPRHRRRPTRWTWAPPSAPLRRPGWARGRQPR